MEIKKISPHTVIIPLLLILALVWAGFIYKMDYSRISTDMGQDLPKKVDLATPDMTIHGPLYPPNIDMTPTVVPVVKPVKHKHRHHHSH
jgi:hypothetical protein